MTTLRLLGGGAAHGLVEALRPAFESGTGCRIEGTFGPVGAMRAKLLNGESADVLILTRALIDELVCDGRVDAMSAADVGTVQTALAVRQGDAPPPIGEAAALRAALLAADEIHFPDPRQATAGIHFDKVLRELGIRDAVADRLRAAPSGNAAMRALAASTARRPVGCTQVTEILAVAGIALVAPLPPGCDLATTYTAVVAAATRHAADAVRLVTALTGDDALAARRRAGFS